LVSGKQQGFSHVIVIVLSIPAPLLPTGGLVLTLATPDTVPTFVTSQLVGEQVDAGVRTIVNVAVGFAADNCTNGGTALALKVQQGGSGGHCGFQDHGHHHGCAKS
jgi:hypothetical protein